MVGLLDEMRIIMLFRKFSKSDHDLYPAYLLPLSPKDLTFEETINLTTREGEGIHKSTAISLRPAYYAEIRLKLLSVLDNNPDIMLYNLVDEYDNFRRLIADSNMVKKWNSSMPNQKTQNRPIN
ncbi:unnamed protein product [Hymenolepis diminuta]|uniref:Uncharacterized protein n=1 Tax=Hymenolepis diminuta TaxID=6216 RepID=A0A564YGW7_HYMDI|nr:unnamed protein product [Hymenolepis diminuta]